MFVLAEVLLVCRCRHFSQELRRFILEHQLEDVGQEEPTSVAEAPVSSALALEDIGHFQELRQGSPEGWLEYLQSPKAQTDEQKTFGKVELW